MANGRTAREIKSIRNEAVVALKMLYPTALPAEQLMRSLLGLFPALEWEYFRRDLAYLCEKGYLQRVVAEREADERLTPWRQRWFRLTSRGVELADHLIDDPAMNP
ncbi:MAG: hypothetical protein H6816_05295 [Phycisphaerales bacterium]|nr:hypothetical protein [Phycisphaerales bacterium]